MEKISAQKGYGRTLGCDRARPGSEVTEALQFQGIGILQGNHLHQAHSNAGEHDETFHCPDSSLNSSTEFRVVNLIQWLRQLFFAEMVEFWHGTSPEMVAKTADLLLKFPEAAFDPETIAVQADDCFWAQTRTGAWCKIMCKRKSTKSRMAL